MNTRDIVADFKKKAKSSNVLGFFSKTCDSSLLEAASFSGMDFVIIDLEHGPVSIETVQHHLMALKNSPMLPVVRVESWKSHQITKVLDIGVLGIQIPSVTTADQVRGVMEQAKFHPQGHRGICRFVRSADYAHQDRYDYFQQANHHLVIVQLEGVQGIEAFDEIIEVEGIDIIFIGPYDLSQSVGYPGQLDHPKVLEIMEELVRKAAQKDIILGTFCDTHENLMHWRDRGIKYLAYSVDLHLFAQKLSELDEIRKHK